jgi:hypothetical protein
LSNHKPRPFDSAEAIELIEAMLAKGLRFHIDLPGKGTFPVSSAHDALRYLEDPDQYFADMYGVRKTVFLAWLDYQKTDRDCMGTTSEGRQCRNTAHKSWSVEPSDFSKSNPDLYCNAHSGQAYEHRGSERVS